MQSKLDGKCKLIDDYLRGKIDVSICRVLEKLYDLAELQISADLKNTLTVVIGLLNKKSLSTEAEQEITETLDKAKDAYNNAVVPNKTDAIWPMVIQVMEIHLNR